MKSSAAWQVKLDRLMCESEIDHGWPKAEEWIDKAIEDNVITPERVMAMGKRLKEWMRVEFIKFCDEEGCADEKRIRFLCELDAIDDEALAIKQVCFALRAERREGNQ